MLVGVVAADVDVVELVPELGVPEAEPDAEAVAEAVVLVVVDEPFARKAGILNLVVSA